MFLNLQLTSTENIARLVRGAGNKVFREMKLKKSYLLTNSTTRKIYYLRIDDLYLNDCSNNINDKQLIPIYQGAIDWDLVLITVGMVRNYYEYTIYDETGAKTADAVTIDLLFEIK